MPETTEPSELVQLVASIDGVPTLPQVDAMIAAAHKEVPSINRDLTIDELLDFRARLTSVQAEGYAA